MSTTEPRWHTPFSIYYSVGRKLGYKDPKSFFAATTHMLAAAVAQRGLSWDTAVNTDTVTKRCLQEQASEYAWLRYGQPTWFIDNETLEVLLTLSHDSDDIRGTFVPYDSLALVFERGARIGKFPLRGLHILAPRAALTETILREINCNLTDEVKMSILIHADTGEKQRDSVPSIDTGKLSAPGVTGNYDNYSEDTPHDDTVRWMLVRGWEKLAPESPDLSAEEFAAIRVIERLCITAMLLNAARPEFLIDYTLPRSQRYEFKGDRDKQRRLSLASPKIIHTGPVMKSAETGRTVAPHIRGWVLRTLRHERYKRNSDGTFKTVLVAPTAIHADQLMFTEDRP